MEIKTINTNEKTLKEAAKNATNNESYIIMSSKTSQILKTPIKGRSNLVLTNNDKPINKQRFSFDSDFRYFTSREEMKFWLYNQEIVFPKKKINIFKFKGDNVKI